MSGVEYNYGDPHLIVDGARVSIDDVVATSAAGTDTTGDTSGTTETIDLVTDADDASPAAEEGAL